MADSKNATPAPQKTKTPRIIAAVMFI